MSSKKTLGSAVPISTGDANFWLRLQSASSKQNVGFFKLTLPSGGPLFIVNMHRSIKMIPFVRTTEELFEETAKRESTRHNFKLVINGPTYGVTKSGKLDAMIGSDPVLPTETLQQGNIVHNKKIIGGRKSNMYFIANYTASAVKYKFDQGAAPSNADAALGNMGPLILNKLPFGQVNKYDPPQPSAKRLGQPKPIYQKALIQRSNKRYGSMVSQPDSVGKIAIGYRKDLEQLLVLIQPHASKGINISGLRGIALQLNLDSAVYLDGSDSVMLMMDNDILISQASNKNETNITGVGFVY